LNGKSYEPGGLGGGRSSRGLKVRRVKPAEPLRHGAWRRQSTNEGDKTGQGAKKRQAAVIRAGGAREKEKPEGMIKELKRCWR